MAWTRSNRRRRSGLGFMIGEERERRLDFAEILGRGGFAQLFVEILVGKKRG